MRESETGIGKDEALGKLQHLIDLARACTDGVAEVRAGNKWTYSRHAGRGGGGVIEVAPLMDGGSYDAVKGFLNHEIGHAEYTPESDYDDFLKAKKDGGESKKLYKSILNVIEDAKVENAMEKRYGGTPAFFRAAMDYVTDRLEGTAGAVGKMHPFNRMLMWTLAKARGHERLASLAGEDEAFGPLMGGFVEKLRTVETEEQSKELAEEIYALFKEIDEHTPKEKGEGEDPMSDIRPPEEDSESKDTSDKKKDKPEESEDEKPEPEDKDEEKPEDEEKDDSKGDEGEEGSDEEKEKPEKPEGGDGDEEPKDGDEGGDEEKDEPEDKPEKDEGDEKDEKPEDKDEGEGKEDEPKDDEGDEPKDKDEGGEEPEDKDDEGPEGDKPEDEDPEGKEDEKPEDGGDDPEDGPKPEDDGEDSEGGGGGGEGTDGGDEPEGGEGGDSGGGGDKGGEGKGTEEDIKGRAMDDMKGEVGEGAIEDYEGTKDAEKETDLWADLDEELKKDVDKDTARRVLAFGREVHFIDCAKYEEDYRRITGCGYGFHPSQRDLDRFVDRLGGESQATFRKISELFINETLVKHEGGKKSGKLHGKALYRSKAGEYNVFRKKRLPKKSSDFAVCLLVDCSGSMGGEEEDHAQETAWMLGEALDRCGIKFAVYGFSSLTYAGHDEPMMLVVKEYGQRWMDRRQHVKYLRAISENYDGRCAIEAYKRLMKVQAENHVMFVVSDGQPAPEPGYVLRAAIEEMRKTIPVVGFGLSYGGIASYYGKESSVVCSSSQLAVRLGGVLKRVLHLGDLRKLK